jgi:hypothetical protein
MSISVERNKNLLSLLPKGDDTRWLTVHYEAIQIDTKKEMERVRMFLALPAIRQSYTSASVKKGSDDLRNRLQNFAELERLLSPGGAHPSDCLLEQLRAVEPQVHPQCPAFLSSPPHTGAAAASTSHKQREKAQLLRRVSGIPSKVWA